MFGLAQLLKKYMGRLTKEKERIIRTVEKEDFLLNQIDEFREKAKQLQTLIASKENKVQELQKLVVEREGKAKELSDIIEVRQDAADRVVSGVGNQIDGMVEKVDAKLNELNETFAERLAESAVNCSEQNEEVRKFVEESNEKLTEAIKELNEQFDKVKNEICEKVHTEDVKCYRNVQALFDESDKKLEELKENLPKVRSLKVMIGIALAFSVLNFAGFAGFILFALGLI